MRLPDSFIKAQSLGHVFPPQGTDTELESGIPLLTFCDDWVRWWSAADIDGFQPPDFWRPDVGLRPFASNPYGDYWAFFPSEDDLHLAVVVQVAHDLNSTQLYAPSFEAFLYRKALDGLAEHDNPDEARLTAETVGIEALAPYMGNGWMDDFKVMMATRPREAKAATDIARARLGWPRFDETFEHEHPDPWNPDAGH